MAYGHSFTSRRQLRGNNTYYFIIEFISFTNSKLIYELSRIIGQVPACQLLKRGWGDTNLRLVQTNDVSVVIAIAIISVVARVLRPSVNQYEVSAR